MEGEDGNLRRAWPVLLVLLSVHTGRPVDPPLILPGISSARTASASYTNLERQEQVVFAKWLSLDSRHARAIDEPDVEDDGPELGLEPDAPTHDAARVDRARAFVRKVRTRRQMSQAEKLIESLPLLDEPPTLVELAATTYAVTAPLAFYD